MKEVYVVNCCRTAVGSFGGSLKDVPAVALGAAGHRFGAHGAEHQLLWRWDAGCTGHQNEDLVDKRDGYLTL